MAIPASVPWVVIGSYAATVFRQEGAVYDQDHARQGVRLPPRSLFHDWENLGRSPAAETRWCNYPGMFVSARCTIRGPPDSLPHIRRDA